jgi:son of sevenless-like protein
MRRYTELVGQARHALRHLDDAALTIDWELAALFMSSSESSETGTSLAQLGPAVSAASKAFSTLLAVVGEQASLVASSSVRGAIGARSPRAPKARPQSTVSTQSRGSRASRRSAFRQRVRGLEEEFLDAEDLELERLAQAGQRELLAGGVIGASGSNPPSAGANASQISLARAGPEPSATSSTTSLPYQKTESDTASTKASNRTSFMKSFMRGRSGSDADDGESAWRKRLERWYSGC